MHNDNQRVHIHIHNDCGHFDQLEAIRRLHEIRARIARSNAKLRMALELPVLVKERHIMSTNPLDIAIDELVTEVAEEETITDSAIAYIMGVPALIQAAVDAALLQGATPAQLTKISELKTKLDAKGEALKAALAANTTPTPPLV